MRRTLLLVAVLGIVATGCVEGSTTLPGCNQADDSVFALMAQAVPSATQVPCLKELPVGWSLSGAQIRNGQAQLWLDSTIAGIHAVEVDMLPSCNVGDAVEVPPAPDEVGMRSYIQPDLPPGYTGARFLVFDGGCVVYRYRFASDAPPTLSLEAEEALSFLPRQSIVQAVEDEVDQTLCGAGAPPCVG